MYFDCMFFPDNLFEYVLAFETEALDNLIEILFNTIYRLKWSCAYTSTHQSKVTRVWQNVYLHYSISTSLDCINENY